MITNIYVDGFNLYYRALKYTPFRWLDLRKLADFRGLRKLKRTAGDRFAAGAVIYDGEITASFGDGMFAVPVRRLLEGRSVHLGEFQLGLDRLGT